MRQLVTLTDDINRPLSTNTGEPNQARRQWSMSTLYAARPNPKHDTRAKAVAWNKRYSDNKKLQVAPAEYPETIPDISPEEGDANYDRLRRLSAEKPNLKIVDPWD
jgi:hypothetical protein